MKQVNHETNTQRKQELRTWCKQKRKQISSEERSRASQAVCDIAWKSFNDWQSAKNRPLHIYAYMPYGAELDIMPLVQNMRAAGHVIYIPRVYATEHRLAWYIWQEQLPMMKGVFGIQEPADTAIPVTEDVLALADLVLVPGLAFDRSGGRLGMGAGYYDRFLARWSNNQLLHTTAPALWSLIYNWQLVEEVPMESHDFPVDVIVNEQELIYTSSDA